jgi:pyruvate dehydrogenase E2 component (dihydrolipoamide acetyltransferase)
MTAFRMPSLGADMTAGRLVEWLRRPGDAVAAGDTIAVVETQKGAIEIEVFQAGVVERLIARIGDTVPVGTPIAELRLAGEPAVGPAPATPAAVTATAIGNPPKASPAARTLAAAHGLDLATLAGSGPEGAIVYVDVENALRAAAPSPPTPPTPVPAPATAMRGGVDPGGLRAAIAAAMTRSKREIPHYYLSTTVDVGAASDRLAALNAARSPERRVLPAALHVKALAATLRRFPDFNGHFVDGAHRPAERIHVGTAIAIRGGGVVAPAIHDADRLAIDEVMDRLRDLVSRVRAGRLRASELTDPTVTLSALGDRGVETIAPIINPPQVAIIGMGTIVERPWIVDGEIGPRKVVTVTLAADHRVSDGHRGALILAALAAALATPELP